MSYLCFLVSIRRISALLTTIFLTVGFISLSEAHAAPSVGIDNYQTKYSVASWARPGAKFYTHHKGEYYICTVGYPATNDKNQHLFITAGHCGDPGDQILQEATDTTDSAGRPSFFAELFEAITGLNNQVRLSPVGKIIAKAGVTPSGNTNDIGIGELDPGIELAGGYSQVPINIIAPKPGMQICKVGTITGRTCGTVIALNRRIRPNNYNATLIANEARICVLSGDSGGPVITNGAAVGIISAGQEINFCDPFHSPNSYITDLPTGITILKKAYPSLHLV